MDREASISKCSHSEGEQRKPLSTLNLHLYYIQMDKKSVLGHPYVIFK